MTCFRLQSGQSLYQYCKEHKIAYKTIYVYCDKLGMSPDDAVELYEFYISIGAINNGHRGTLKYYYKNVPLRRYCKEHNLSYNTIREKLRLGFPIEELITKHFKRK